MGSLNKVTLIGSLGGAPQLRYTPKATAVATFSLATEETWKDKDGATQRRTEWHHIVVWGKLAEIVSEHTAKGRQVCIVGRIRSRKYEDREKVERTAYEIHADEIVMLGKREGTDDAQASDSAPPEDVPAPESAENGQPLKEGSDDRGKKKSAKK